MYRIQTLNNISKAGIKNFPEEKYEIATDINNPDAIIVRSFNMNDMLIPDSIKAIARAGAGVNNIPVSKCTEKGIVVFNTPGANANSVKELVITGLFLCSRNIVKGIDWAKTLIGKGDEVPKLIEKGKSNFSAHEIKGRTLGVIGLGAIGVMVANDAISMGMNVCGYDPFISVESAWGLSRYVKREKNIESLIKESDYITIHIPLTEKTKGIINSKYFNLMRKGISILNFARGGLVNNKDLKESIDKGIVSKYITDFPDEELLKLDRVICIPHLGASTPEAEDNCATMAVDQIQQFLEQGNIKNSVNFPECEMLLSGKSRIIIVNKNIPNMVGQITTLLAKAKINISDMLNQHKGDIAYTIIDVDENINHEIIQMINKIEGIILARIL